VEGRTLVGGGKAGVYLGVEAKRSRQNKTIKVRNKTKSKKRQEELARKAGAAKKVGETRSWDEWTKKQDGTAGSSLIATSSCLGGHWLAARSAMSQQDRGGD